MSLGSPTRTASLALALRVCTRPAMPAIFSSRREPPTDDDEEEMDTTGDDAEDKED